MALDDKKVDGNICTFCGEGLAKGEFHEEFDYFKHPMVKGQLNALNERYKSLPLNEQLYRMENWAVKRGLRRGANILDEKGNRKPDGGTVVMPGYQRLVNADRWLRRMSDGVEVKKSELPF